MYNKWAQKFRPVHTRTTFLSHLAMNLKVLTFERAISISQDNLFHWCVSYCAKCEAILLIQKILYCFCVRKALHEKQQ